MNVDLSIKLVVRGRETATLCGTQCIQANCIAARALSEF